MEEISKERMVKIVVDTNVLVSFFRENPIHEIISKSKILSLQFFSPEYALDELIKNKEDVLKYAKISLKQFEKKLSELFKYIKIIPLDFFKEHEEEAKQIIHDKDVPIFALALQLKCSIWSNEPLFKKQNKVEIFSNRDMIELFC